MIYEELKNKSGNKRGLHGNQGAKKKADARVHNLNIRFNDVEIELFNQHWQASGLNQREFILFLLNKHKNRLEYLFLLNKYKNRLP